MYSLDLPNLLNYWLPHVKAVIAHAKALGIKSRELSSLFGILFLRKELLKEFVARRLDYRDFIT